MFFCTEELTKKSIGYNPSENQGCKTVNAKSLKVYASFKRNEDPTLEVDEDGNVKILVGKISVGGVK